MNKGKGKRYNVNRTPPWRKGNWDEDRMIPQAHTNKTYLEVAEVSKTSLQHAARKGSGEDPWNTQQTPWLPLGAPRVQMLGKNDNKGPGKNVVSVPGSAEWTSRY